MRALWIFPLLLLGGMVAWMATRPSAAPARWDAMSMSDRDASDRDASDGDATDPAAIDPAGWTDRPSLRGARERSPVPHGLVLHVRSSDGRGVPAELVGVLATPPSLRGERMAREGGTPTEPIDRAFSGADVVDGRVELRGLRYRLWDLRVLAPGCLGVGRELVLPPLADGEPPVVDVVLDPFARVVVRVSDADGAAVSGATVRIVQPDLDALLRDRPLHPQDDPGPGGRGRARTNARGAAALDALPGTVELRVEVSHPDHPRQVVRVAGPPPGAERTVDVQLARPAGIRGEIDLAAFGLPPEAIVLTDYHHKGRDSTFEARVPIAADGSFHRRNVRPGRHTIQVTGRGPHGAHTALHAVDVPAATTVDVGVIGPGPGTPLRLLVHVEEPVPQGARVRALVLRHASGEEARDAATDRFAALEFAVPIGHVHEIRGLPEGTLVCHFRLVDIRGRDITSAHRPPRVAVLPEQRDETVEVVFRHKPAPPPRVMTTFRVRPPEDVSPRALRWALLILDEDGTVRGGSGRCLPPGSSATGGMSPAIDVPVSVYVLGHGRMAGPRRMPHLAEPTTLEFTRWRPAAVVGLRVEDPEGRPLADVPVEVSLDPTGRVVALVERTGDDGRVELTVIPGMDLHVTARIPGPAEPPKATLRAGELAAGARATRTLRAEAAR